MTDRQLNELSERELEILRLVATGASNKEIAQQLFISANTVKVHLRNIFSKIGAASRTEAALYCIRLGLVETEAAVVEEEDSSIGARGIVDNPSGYSVVSEGVQAASAQQTWTEQTAVPFPSTQHPSASIRRWILPVGGLILLLGLVILTVVIKPFQAAEPLSTPAPELRWQELAPLPSPRSALAVTTYEGHIYAIGGQAPEGVTGTVERFDPENNHWEMRTQKNFPVKDIQAAVVGGLIYTPAGCLNSGAPTNMLESYDPRQDVWVDKEPLPAPLCGYAMVAFEGRLYLFGGWNGKEYLSTVYIYHPDRDQWTQGAPMDTPRAYASAVVVGGKIFLIGGYDGTRALDRVDIYIPERDLAGEDPWTKAASMPSGRYSMGIATAADVIYLLGGKMDTKQQHEAWIYLPQQDEWQVIGALDLAEAGSGATNLGLHIYSIGGEQSGAPSDHNRAFQAIYTLSIPVIVK